MSAGQGTVAANTRARGGGSISTESLDYIQRCELRPAPVTKSAGQTSAAAAARRLLRVRGIGRHDKGSPAASDHASWRLATEDLVTGLYGYRIPLALLVTGNAEGINVNLGVWSSRAGTGADVLDRRGDVLASVLRGLYPAITLEPSSASDGGAGPLAGIALGVPTVKRPVGGDPAAPWDRVIRSLTGGNWSVLVLAHPVAESALADLRDGVLNEVRVAENQVRSEGAPSPLTEQYIELLRASMKSLTQGVALGTWRTAVYLLGDGESYPRLGSIWRSVFSGEHSVPEPVRVFDLPEAASLARSWTMPDQQGEVGPGHYQRPFEHQTLLTSTQLAAYIHLPEMETPGFNVDLVPNFDAAAASVGAKEDQVTVGTVVHRMRETRTDYTVSRQALTRHAFVAGVTGSGKTNTILALLTRVHEAKVPFLVVEPAKTEYRGLLGHPTLGKRLRIFTAGDETVSPLRLNPFEVPEGVGVSEHIDLLRAAFGASFGMWTPLPQVLERCLHEIYRDRGWDISTNRNTRLQPGEYTISAFPTLTELVAKVKEVAPQLGYEQRVTDDIEAALTTRLESLRTGGKGAMFDVARSLPMEELLGQPTVLELEAIGDEGDKAFLMGLLLVRLGEHRRGQGAAGGLVHLLVIEEAHRLLSHVPARQSEETADPRGQAISTFVDLLSEIRAYGQGVIVADQVPARLAPEVLKNTNLKIAHRIVAADDRTGLGGTMAMDADQTRALTSLGVGEAAVFGAGDDAPVMVRVPPVKDRLGAVPADAAVAKWMAKWRTAAGLDQLYLAQPFCIETCAGSPEACAAARRLVGDEYVQRIVARTVLSVIEDPDALDRLWDELLEVVRARRPVLVEEAELLAALAGHSSHWWAQRRGSQAGWSYADTDDLGAKLRAVLLDKASGRATRKVRTAFSNAARELHRRTYAPYPGCDAVCDQDPPLCLYRWSVADVVRSRRFEQVWREAETADDASPDLRTVRTWNVCQDAGYELIEFPEVDYPQKVNDGLNRSAGRTCLCFAQQMLADGRRVPRSVRRGIARLMVEARGVPEDEG